MQAEPGMEHAQGTVVLHFEFRARTSPGRRSALGAIAAGVLGQLSRISGWIFSLREACNSGASLDCVRCHHVTSMCGFSKAGCTFCNKNTIANHTQPTLALPLLFQPETAREHDDDCHQADGGARDQALLPHSRTGCAQQAAAEVRAA